MNDEAEVDVVVVGGGGSALAAAAAAAELGRSVVLLEKNSKLGGSTAMSVGSISATCTSHQIRKGIKDYPDDHLEDLKLFSAAQVHADNFDLSRVLTDNITATFAWLQSIGLEFVGPMPEPPHRQPRMHNVLPNSEAFPYHLGRYCRRLGVDVRCGVHAQKLLERGGRVAGVVATTDDGRQCTFYARAGIVLAAGDFSADREMKTKYGSPEVGMVEPFNTTATGDGFRLALEHGAVMVGTASIKGLIRFVPPQRSNLLLNLPPFQIVTRVMKWCYEHLPESLLRPLLMRFLTTSLGPSPELFRQGAILINRNGERFVDELAGPGISIAQEPERVAYIVFDGTVADRFSRWPYFISTAPGVAYAYLDDYRATRPDLFHSAETLVQLAEKLNLNPAALEATVAACNASPDRSATNGDRRRIDRPPFIALGPIKSYILFTNGSLRVSERLEVLDATGKPIAGLFAAGSNGQGGMLLEGHGHHLGWAFTSGRLAGRQAAFFRQAQDARAGVAAEKTCAREAVH